MFGIRKNLFFLYIYPFFFCYIGGCRNSSPAGKRRVPGSEYSSNDPMAQPGSAEMYESIGGSVNGDDSANLATTAATAMAIAICFASVAVFAAVFVALQVNFYTNLFNVV